VALDQRFDERYLTAFGFLLFGLGLGMSCVQTRTTDYDEMFWPQFIRGCATMFCILPPTRLAMGHLSKTAIPDASGLFNLMRNLGGAIGIALIDTMIYSRAPIHARRITDRLLAGDLDAARMLGVPPDLFGPALFDPANRAILAPLIERGGFVEAINDAWALVALSVLVALAVVPLARATPRPTVVVLYK